MSVKDIFSIGTITLSKFSERGVRHKLEMAAVTSHYGNMSLSHILLSAPPTVASGLCQVSTYDFHLLFTSLYYLSL